MTKQDANKYAIVVLSHSSYVDLWPVLMQSYTKYFNDRNFDYYITSDGDSEGHLNGSLFKMIKYADDAKWSDALFDSVEKINYEKIIFTFDDLVLTKKVDANLLIDFLEKNTCNYLKLICSHVKFYDRFFRFSKVFKVRADDSYRGSLVFTALDSSILSSLACNEKLRSLSPWEYERKINTYLLDDYSYCSVRKNIFTFENLVIKGGINYLSHFKLRIFHDLNYKGHRSVLSVGLMVGYYSKLLIFTVVKYFLPSALFLYFRQLRQKAIKQP